MYTLCRARGSAARTTQAVTPRTASPTPSKSSARLQPTATRSADSSLRTAVYALLSDNHKRLSRASGLRHNPHQSCILLWASRISSFQALALRAAIEARVGARMHIPGARQHCRRAPSAHHLPPVSAPPSCGRTWHTLTALPSTRTHTHMKRRSHYRRTSRPQTRAASIRPSRPNRTGRSGASCLLRRLAMLQRACHKLARQTRIHAAP